MMNHLSQAAKDVGRSLDIVGVGFLQNLSWHQYVLGFKRGCKQSLMVIRLFTHSMRIHNQHT